jgi:hypothetical protein
VASVTRLPVAAAADTVNARPASDPVGEAEPADMPAQRHEGVLESAALSVALQAPVLTLAGGGSEAPGLVRHWSDSGLAAVSWRTLHAVSALAEQQRWWQATVASGASATVASAAAIGVRLALAQVVAPAEPCLCEAEPATGWIAEIPTQDAWGDGEGAPPRAWTNAAPWWREAQALWLEL